MLQVGYMARKYVAPRAVTETTYNLIYTLGQHLYDPDCNLFIKVRWVHQHLSLHACHMYFTVLCMQYERCRRLCASMASASSFLTAILSFTMHIATHRHTEEYLNQAQ